MIGAGAVAATILIVLAVVHLYWAAGGALGKDAAIPVRDGRPLLRPTPTVTYIVAAGLFAMALLVMTGTGWLVGLIGAVFIIRAVGDFRYIGFFKTVRAGRFARLDTLAYSPLSLLLGILIAISATGR